MAGDFKGSSPDSAKGAFYREVHDIPAEIAGLSGRKLVIYPESIRNPVGFLHDDDVISIAVEDGENLKSIAGFEHMLEIMLDHNLDRGDYVIPVGGGTLTDAAGFAASVFKRGVKLINVPTTLLAMVDAAVGGKTAINFHGTKNIAGTFYFPEQLWINVDFLYTLPQREYRSGTAEMLKYGLIMDKNLLELMQENSDRIAGRERSSLIRSITGCIEDKMTIVSQDPYEQKGIRNILNYGHTIGHSIEAASGFRITHGEAISLGMVLENMFGEAYLGASSEIGNTVREILRSFSLPVSPDELGLPLDNQILKDSLRRDKKSRSGRINMPFIKEMGKAEVVAIPVEDLGEFLDREIS